MIRIFTSSMVILLYCGDKVYSVLESVGECNLCIARCNLCGFGYGGAGDLIW